MIVVRDQNLENGERKRLRMGMFYGLARAWPALAMISECIFPKCGFHRGHNLGGFQRLSTGGRPTAAAASKTPRPRVHKIGL